VSRTGAVPAGETLLALEGVVVVVGAGRVVAADDVLSRSMTMAEVAVAAAACLLLPGVGVEDTGVGLGDTGWLNRGVVVAGVRPPMPPGVSGMTSESLPCVKWMACWTIGSSGTTAWRVWRLKRRVRLSASSWAYSAEISMSSSVDSQCVWPAPSGGTAPTLMTASLLQQAGVLVTDWQAVQLHASAANHGSTAAMHGKMKRGSSAFSISTCNIMNTMARRGDGGMRASWRLAASVQHPLQHSPR